MTTVENDSGSTAAVPTARSAATRQAEAAPETHTAEQATAPVVPVQERFGGVKLGAAFFGWLVAVGMTVLLSGLVALVAALWRAGGAALPADAAAVGTTGMVTVLAVLAVAYFTGGYVAGRLARFDGARNGLCTWLVGLVGTVLAAIAAAVLATRLPAMALPTLPVPVPDVSTLTIGGAVLLAAIVVVTALAAALGGRLGERFHRRVDRAAGLR